MLQRYYFIEKLLPLIEPRKELVVLSRAQAKAYIVCPRDLYLPFYIPFYKLHQRLLQLFAVVVVIIDNAASGLGPCQSQRTNGMNIELPVKTFHPSES